MTTSAYSTLLGFGHIPHELELYNSREQEILASLRSKYSTNLPALLNYIVKHRSKTYGHTGDLIVQNGKGDFDINLRQFAILIKMQTGGGLSETLQASDMLRDKLRNFLTDPNTAYDEDGEFTTFALRLAHFVTDSERVKPGEAERSGLRQSGTEGVTPLRGHMAETSPDRVNDIRFMFNPRDTHERRALWQNLPSDTNERRAFVAGVFKNCKIPALTQLIADEIIGNVTSFDPLTIPHLLLQRFNAHPLLERDIEKLGRFSAATNATTADIELLLIDSQHAVNRQNQLNAAGYRLGIMLGMVQNADSADALQTAILETLGNPQPAPPAERKKRRPQNKIDAFLR